MAAFPLVLQIQLELECASLVWLVSSPVGGEELWPLSLSVDEAGGPWGLRQG